APRRERAAARREADTSEEGPARGIDERFIRGRRRREAGGTGVGRGGRTGDQGGATELVGAREHRAGPDGATGCAAEEAQTLDPAGRANLAGNRSGILTRERGERAAMTDAETTERSEDTDETEHDEDVTDDLEERLVAEGEIAGDYLEELLDLLDFDGDIDLDVEGTRAVVSIDGGDDLTKLVGRKGEVLDALQELTRLAVHQKTGVRSRLMLDIARWRRRRREELAVLGG